MSRRNVDLGSGSVGKLLFSLAVPTITSQIVNMLYNLVDRVYICLLYTSVERRLQYPGHRPRRGGGVLPELCHQPGPGGGGHPAPHHSQRRTLPRAGRTPVHVHAAVAGGSVSIRGA